MAVNAADRIEISEFYFPCEKTCIEAGRIGWTLVEGERHARCATNWLSNHLDTIMSVAFQNASSLVLHLSH